MKGDSGTQAGTNSRALIQLEISFGHGTHWCFLGEGVLKCSHKAGDSCAGKLSYQAAREDK